MMSGLVLPRLQGVKALLSVRGFQVVTGKALTGRPVTNVKCPPFSHPAGHARCGSTSSLYDHDALRSHFHKHLKTPEYFNFAKDIVGVWAHKKPGHPALRVTDGREETLVTYSELFSQAQALATALAHPAPPRCALLVLPKVVEWWVVCVAASWCGMIISPGTSLLTPGDVVHRLAESEADCVVCGPAMAAALDPVTRSIPRRLVVTHHSQHVPDGWIWYQDLLESARGRPTRPCVLSRGDDIAQIFFTSGTTGKPKMVPHTQASYGIGLAPAARFWLDLTEDDVLWNISDPGWAKSAWSSLYIPFMVGATVFVHQMAQFDPEECVRALREHRVTVLCAPPTAYRALLQLDLTRQTFPSLRHCVSAGEPLNPEAMQLWQRSTGVAIYEGYGQTETTLVACAARGMGAPPGSMGKAAPGYTLTIIDEKQQELGPNEEGYIAVSLKDHHPIGLFTGYLQDERRSSEVFVGGYYITGDRGYYDDRGFFWFVGRADDLIISAGYRIGPFEVESALLEHPAVVESAVVSSPDALRGEVVKAFVVLAADYKDQEPADLVVALQDHVKRSTAPYKYPRKVEFVDALPKTVSGKIRRVELRSREWGRA